MSGPSDLARLKVTIDTANEIFLSQEIKLVDAGGGVMRPTNAKVLSDLAAQMSGALVYTSKALGLSGTLNGGYFSVISPNSDEYISLYRNDSGTATYVDSYPNATKVRSVANDVGELDVRITGAQESITGISQEVSIISTNLVETQDGLVSLSEAVDGVSLSLSDTKVELNGLASDVGDVASRLTTAEGDVIQLSEDVVIVDKKFGDLIERTSYPSPEVEILVVTDDEGGKHATLTSRRLTTEWFELSGEEGKVIVGDGEGATPIFIDAERVQLGEMEFLRTAQPGFFNTDLEGGIIPDQSGVTLLSNETVADPFAVPPVFAPLIVTAEGYSQKIHVQSLLAQRELGPMVTGSVASTTTSASQTGEILEIHPGRFGTVATLNLREVSKPNIRKLMVLQVRDVPVQTVPISPRILIIGDSICNRQGGQFLKQILTELGLTPVFIGTMKGSGSASNANDITGELGEAREGWETGDFTNEITDRVIVVPPGEEGLYEEMSKTDKWPRNPFLRAATSSDAVEIVRNGHVFDPAFYQARFGLETPDIVLNMLGTNDVRDRTDSTIYDAVLGNDTLMHNQIRTAWPKAKIIRSIPTTSRTTARDILWTCRYVPAIQAMQRSAANRADDKFALIPAWTLTSPEVGYSYSAGSPGVDGFSTSGWADTVHPIQASRRALFEAIAPYIAAAALNIILPN